MAFYEQFPEDFDLDDIDRDGQGKELAFWFAGQHPGSTLCFDSSLYRNHGTLTSMDPPTDWVDGHHGMALDFDGSNDYVNLGTRLGNWSEFTISLFFKPAQTGIFHDLFGKDDATNGIRFGATTANVLYARTYSGGGFATITGVGTFTTGLHYHFALRRDTAGRLYINGKPDQSAALGAPGDHSAVAAYMGNIAGFTRTQGAISDVRVYSRALTDSEVWDIYSNPTGIILPRRKTLKRNAAAGTFSIAADSGSYSLTGTAATLKFGRLLSAGSGSFSVTGSSADVLFGRKLAANSGSFSVTGTAATPKFGRLLSAGSGAYSISGKPANLTFSGAQLRKYQFLLRRAFWRTR